MCVLGCPIGEWYFVPYCTSSLLRIPVLGSSVGVWYYMSHCTSSLLIIPVLGSPVCESYSVPWLVSTLTMAVLDCPGSQLIPCLDTFKPADGISFMLSRLWVAAVHHYMPSFLTIPLLGPLGGEWCSIPMLYFKLAYNNHSGLSSMSVAIMPCCFSSLLMTPVLVQSTSQCLFPFLAFWQYLSLAFQIVSSFCNLVFFWACWMWLFSTPQLVSGSLVPLHFKFADHPYCWLSSL